MPEARQAGIQAGASTSIPASPVKGCSLGYGCELKNFIDCIRTKRQPESDLELALDVTLTIYAGYVSAEERGREVEVVKL
jgi:predicted dehydrogenase